MATKKLEELPVVGDAVVLELSTFGYGDARAPTDPHSIDRVAIYYIERDAIQDEEVYVQTSYDKSTESHIGRLQTLCAADPSPRNLEELTKARVRLKATSIVRPCRFKDGIIVYSVEGEVPVKHVAEGLFEFTWDTTGYKEGDYYVVWSWTPEKGGKQQREQKTFFIDPAPLPFTALSYIQQAPTDKYDFLMKKYLPTMYKTRVNVDDVTAEVMDGLNWCVARELIYLENILALLVESYDANLCPPKMLQLLANFYNLKLRTDNTVLQRRQVKTAIPLLQMKGTKEGLGLALSQAGIRIRKLSLLWQVRSPHTWAESIRVSNDDEVIHELDRMPVNDDFKVSLRSQEKSEYIDLPGDYFLSVDSLDGRKKMLVFQPDKAGDVRLLKGDLLRVSYQVKEMPKDWAQIEEYIQGLPLADDRDETKQVYPLKNWNVHLIEDDDPLFDVIIKERHPFDDPVTFGQVRTTFLFSENVYNMDTFNGSLRDSKEPCHIDKDFLDECSACRSSKFNIDIEVEELSDWRITEAMEIIKEYTPFHAQLNTLNVCGVVNDFILMPHEDIEMLVDYSVNDNELTEMMGYEEEITCKIEYSDGRVEEIKL